MEIFGEMMKSFLGTQQQVMDAMGKMHENVKSPADFMKNYNKVVENSVKFHTAAIKYHEAVAEMMESMNAIRDVYKTKP